MPRKLFWLQLIIGWLPMWALFTTLMLSAHPGVPPLAASLVGLRMIVTGAVLGLVVQRKTERFPWPHPLGISFVAGHALAACAFAAAWVTLNSAVESVLHGAVVIVVGGGIVPFLILGVWLYVMVAGVTYATRATERAARAEANAARSQLAALRSQLNPHFLFNALHSVVQLIPREPRRAAHAAEELGGLLRYAIEEDRDLVLLAEERAFVERYLALERVRFGDRLRLRFDVTKEAEATLIPSFALLTLVENAVRHGAEPSVEPTDITVMAVTTNGAVMLTVCDTGAGASAERLEQTDGTGLGRLRERLVALYGTRARLELTPGAHGFTASLTVPLEPG